MSWYTLLFSIGLYTSQGYYLYIGTVCLRMGLFTVYRTIKCASSAISAVKDGWVYLGCEAVYEDTTTDSEWSEPCQGGREGWRGVSCLRSACTERVRSLSRLFSRLDVSGVSRAVGWSKPPLRYLRKLAYDAAFRMLRFAHISLLVILFPVDSIPAKTGRYNRRTSGLKGNQLPTSRIASCSSLP